MVQNYLSGFLVLIASIIIFYQSIILYKKRWYIFFTIPLGVCMVALGCAGFYKKDLDGINILLFGLTMFYIIKRRNSFLLRRQSILYSSFNGLRKYKLICEF